MDRISRGSTIANDLRRRIVLNELRPGVAITELALAAEYESSQGAVREALMRVEGEGLVARSGHQGTTVTGLAQEEAEEILGLRRRMEGRAAAPVARRIVAGEIADLHEILGAMLDAAARDDLWAMVQADTAFHLSLFRVAGLHAMQPILARCILHTHRFRLWAPWHRRPLQATAERHRPIIAALEARDGPGLQREIETHLATLVEQKRAA